MKAYTQAAAPLTPDYESPALFDNELGQMRGLAEVWTEQRAAHREYVKSYAPLEERSCSGYTLRTACLDLLQSLLSQSHMQQI